MHCSLMSRWLDGVLAREIEGGDREVKRDMEGEGGIEF